MRIMGNLGDFAGSVGNHIGYALLAGSLISAACGLIGYVLVVRAQAFGGDILGHTAFTGAMAALVLGVSPQLGLIVLTGGVALILGVIGTRGKPDDVVLGSAFSWVLGLGALFLYLFSKNIGAERGGVGVSMLFGSVLGLSLQQVIISTTVSVLAIAGVCSILRPLLFASIDPIIAASQGIRVSLLGCVFMVIVGLCVGQATQAVGSLLVMGLAAAPACTAMSLTSRIYRGVALSVMIAVAQFCLGIAVCIALPTVPPSFAIVAVGAMLLAAASTYAFLQRAKTQGGANG